MTKKKRAASIEVVRMGVEMLVAGDHGLDLLMEHTGYLCNHEASPGEMGRAIVALASVATDYWLVCITAGVVHHCKTYAIPLKLAEARP